ncbi:MAG: response regulator [Proteobacteria bacterium]|nr:response regulator [Pseudomonadota bacterium]MBU1059662.1 response regulator [Pseudomonadota bacterium]
MATDTPFFNWNPALRKQLFLLILACIVVCSALTFLAVHGQNLYLHNIHRQHATLTANHINSLLTRQLTTASKKLSQQPDVLPSVLHQTAPDHPSLTAQLLGIRNVLSAAIVYVMDKDGLVTASTAANSMGTTLTGNNYRFRPYFTNAMAGKSTCYPAIGITTNQRGLYFSSPIRDNNEQPVGVAVIKSGLEQITTILDEAPSAISLLVSEENIIFAVSKAKRHWLYHATNALTPTDKKEIIESRQFGNSPLNDLPVDLNQEKVFLDTFSYRVVSTPIDLPGWHLSTLEKRHPPYLLASSIVASSFFLTYLLVMNLIATLTEKQLKTGMATEIEQRKDAQSQLQESEKRYRTLFENSQDANLLIDTPHIIDCNEAALRLFGYDNKEELLGKHPGKLSPPLQEDGSQSWKKAEEMMNTAIHKRSHKYQWRHLHKNGVPFWTEVSITTLSLQNKTLLHTIIRDITEKKYEEEQLQLYFRAVSQSIDGICITNLDGVMQYTNQAWDTMHGYRSEEQLGKNLSLHHTDKQLQEDLTNMLQEVLRVGHMIKIIGHRKKDTSEFQTLTSVTALLDKEGAASGFLVISRDITERIDIEQKSRVLSQAVEQNFDGIVLTDLNERILRANAAWATMHGFPDKDSLVNQQLSFFHTPGQNEKELTPFLKEVRRKGHHFAEIGHVRQDGSLFPTAMNISQFQDEQEKPIGLLVTARDISMQKDTEQSLIQAKEEAEAANQAKGEFLANMSHEIRTPMNGIMGMTRLLMNSSLSPDQLNQLRMVQSSASRLLGIINDILDFSKIEAGKLLLEEVPFSLEEKLEELFILMAPKAGERHIILKRQIPAEIPRHLIGDPSRLTQILINLVNNGLKFTENGSVSINITLEQSTVSDCLLRFAIQDTGIGIPKEKQAIIFQSFSQADTSHTRKYGGTGLGLTISSQLCHLMGGEIGLESEEGKGATFWFTSRFKRPLRTQTQKNSNLGTLVQSGLSRQEILQGMSILLAEDEFINMTLAIAVLGEEGLQVTTAFNGREAVELFQKGSFDAILMDIQMPEMDGYQATAAIRAHEKLHSGHVPIIAMTAHAMQGDREKCLAAGMDDYLSKPLDPETMFQVIERQLINSVLVAEDEPASRVIAGKIFMDMGWQVTLAENGKQALYECTRSQFNLIILDLQMPDIDGLETIREIRKREQETGKHACIIALTTRSPEEGVEQCLDAGMDAFLEKPITAAKIQEKLEKLSIKQYK